MQKLLGFYRFLLSTYRCSVSLVLGSEDYSTDVEKYAVNANFKRRKLQGHAIECG